MNTVFVIITSKCNRFCEYCFYKQDKYRKKEDKIEAKKINDFLFFLKKNGFNELTITGGEPLLRKKDTIKIIRNAKKLGYYTNLDTNGTLINKENFTALLKSGLDCIYLSGEYIEYLDKSILTLLIKSFKVWIIKVVTKKNANKLGSFIGKYSKLKIPLIIQPAYINKGSKFYKDLDLFFLPQKEWKILAKTLTTWAKNNKKQEYLKFFLSYYVSNKPCRPSQCKMINALVIDSDGSVYPCFHRQDLLAGNIFSDNFSKIIANINNYKRRLKNSLCYGEQCISLLF